MAPSFLNAQTSTPPTLASLDAARRSALARMKWLAAGLRVVMALAVAESFALQERNPWLR